MGFRRLSRRHGPRTRQRGLRALLALLTPPLDAGVIQALPAQDRSFLTRRSRIVFVKDPRLVSSRESPALGPVASRPAARLVCLEPMVRHPHLPRPPPPPTPLTS